MSWRTVVIHSRSKLEYKLNYLVVRGEAVLKIHLSEVAILIIENTSVSLTASLLSELNKRKIKIIFCDEKRNPYGEIISYYGSHDTSGKVRDQLQWTPDIKGEVWTKIVCEKIRQQSHVLMKQQKSEYRMLEQYSSEVLFNDTSNREGHAAKVYFNALFGKSFTRDEDSVTNAALNYGYSILLSVFNREIASNGYITQVGLMHDNQFNSFNFASDLMEPFRPLVDQLVTEMKLKQFTHEEKMMILSLLELDVVIEGRKQVLLNAIKIYSKSIFDALDTKDSSQIRFYQYEL